jgi:hypothetical protein
MRNILWGPVTASTVGALIARYEKEEMPARYSTRASYTTFIKNYLRPRWGEVPIADVKAIAVEDWLKRLTLAPKTQRHIKGSMSTIFRCAQRWELREDNPLELVRVKGSSKRKERPSILIPEQTMRAAAHPPTLPDDGARCGVSRSADQ